MVRQCLWNQDFRARAAPEFRGIHCRMPVAPAWGFFLRAPQPNPGCSALALRSRDPALTRYDPSGYAFAKVPQEEAFARDKLRNRDPLDTNSLPPPDPAKHASR